MSKIVVDKIFYDSLMKDQIWGMIHRAANHDPVLKGLLDKAEVYWKLKYDNMGKIEPDADI